MPDQVSLAITADENYLDGLVGTLAGAASSTKSSRIDAKVLDCGITDSSWTLVVELFSKTFPSLNLSRHQIRPEQLSVFNPSGKKRRLNTSTYARLVVPDLFKDLERIIYLDSDLHIDADLQILYDWPLDGALIGAVQEAHLPAMSENVPAAYLSSCDRELPAFNCGMLLMDLAAIRRDKLIEQIIEQADSIGEKFQDQGMLNYALRGKWKSLPTCWNRQLFVTENFSIFRDHPNSIWHFIGKMKPWHFAPQHQRGLVADFYDRISSIGWTPKKSGTWKPRSSAWRDLLKAGRAYALRQQRRLYAAKSVTK